MQHRFLMKLFNPSDNQIAVRVQQLIFDDDSYKIYEVLKHIMGSWNLDVKVELFLLIKKCRVVLDAS